jgi:hypothetical protein
MVHVAYIDETYSAEELWLVGLVIPDVGAKALESALNEKVHKRTAVRPP